MRWSEDIVAFAGSLRPPIEMFRRAQSSLLEMIDYFGKLVPERRANKGDDLISLLLRAEEDGDILTPEQVLSNCAQLIFAGHETTRNLLSNGLHALLNHPEELARLRADPSLMPGAVRELLRYESPLQFIRRVASQDMDLWGVRVKEGQGVVLMLGSANRDERAWERPDRLDIARVSRNHVAFGHGIHLCIGAALAQMEAEIGFAAVLRRFPGVRLDGAEPVRVMNPMLRGASPGRGRGSASATSRGPRTRRGRWPRSRHWGARRSRARETSPPPRAPAPPPERCGRRWAPSRCWSTARGS
jgi:cytochrome P450